MEMESFYLQFVYFDKEKQTVEKVKSFENPNHVSILSQL
jgi:hypothetical protein